MAGLVALDMVEGASPGWGCLAGGQVDGWLVTTKVSWSRVTQPPGHPYSRLTRDEGAETPMDSRRLVGHTDPPINQPGKVEPSGGLLGPDKGIDPYLSFFILFLFALSSCHTDIFSP